MARHSVMPTSLARALIEAGVQHFDTGGTTQGGIGGFLSAQNQFQATAPVITTQDFAPQISTLQQQNQDVYNQQQSLARALLAQSQGQGPNPAAASLNNQTGQNIATTAALMAGNRGANANAGLLARQIAQQRAATQQAAVGQGAQLQAEQELGAESTLGGVLGNEASNALQGQSIAQGAQASQNSALTTGQLGASETNAQISAANAAQANKSGGGLFGAIGSALGALFYKGGKVPRFADGGIASYATPVDPRVVINTGSPDSSTSDATSQIAGELGSGVKDLIDSSSASSTDNPGISLGVDTSLPTPSAVGLPGVAPTVPSIPDLMPTNVQGLVAPSLPRLSRGGPIDFRTGGPVPGKAKVPGNSPKNDTVPALLSPGEDVLPRSVTMAPDAPERAKKFVEALQDKKGTRGGFGKVVKARATLKDRVERLEKLCGGGMAA